ncbi:hypothetical protein SUGI_0283920 [Cryptomeria japonica]|uniref:uncharacterized protein LOC131063904 n=1 Tax=Cryptomeria japonica TaxID=3369 RepID=UPI002408E519|nr:uncharacterized protein LOC131063904 [Cryptomeria japonica]XP_059074450.1 uncharacterized protein LOC131063904 [Cryptomeria japonica]XP_059074451.1 uncharacterized protein LOC131063904 [Cryptomeria japonica]GLJ16581.1 hypothetical protein SUGI_0283920 [Cryptomeria japonica]
MESSKKNDSQNVIVLNKSLKLAEGWVKQMNVGEDSAKDAEEVEIQIRPQRLGLGAKFVPHSKFANTLNPVEKKLRAKLNAAKRQSALSTEELCSADKDSKAHELKHSNVDDYDDDDGDSESRASTFNKHREKYSADSLQSLVTYRKKAKKQKQFR